ncbi:MAG: branched-chain amino acid ABC transporter ATP-binding protein/permease [Pseudomonadota bacterium]
MSADSAVDALEMTSASDRARLGVSAALTAILLIGIVLALTLALGRQGERMATQLSINVAATVALAVFSGNSGIVSFGHAALMGVGAYLSGILTMAAGLQRSALPMLPDFLAGHEMPVLAALVIVAVAGAGFSLAVGLAISRLAGASATIATLGLLIIVHSVLVGARELTRGSQTFYGVPRVTDLTVALAAAVVFIALAFLFRESRHGLRLRAVRDDEAAAQAIGIDPRRARLVGWIASGTLAAVAGALYGHMLGAFSPQTFYASLTFALVAMLIVGGLTTVSGAVVGAIVVTLAQDAVRQVEGGFTIAGVEMPSVFGLTTVALAVFILLALWLRPDGIVGTREIGWPWLARRIAKLLPKRTTAASSPQISEIGDLEVEGLTRRFGGLVAVNAASFRAPGGTVTGLIGPNGAGKSTIVNLLTGHDRASAGRMAFGPVNLSALPPHGFAALGIARTFQNLRLFANLTVRENVLVAGLASGLSRAEASALADRALSRMDLRARAGTPASALPYGEAKRLEIARCLALRPRFILLDEPAAGLNPDETNDLADRLARLSVEDGIGMLLIDHDLGFVNRLSSAIVVINKGEVIAAGAPDAVRADPAVIEAYIGRSDRAEAGAPALAT